MLVSQELTGSELLKLVGSERLPSAVTAFSHRLDLKKNKSS